MLLRIEQLCPGAPCIDGSWLNSLTAFGMGARLGIIRLTAELEQEPRMTFI